jgi:hypothetical protein
MHNANQIPVTSRTQPELAERETVAGIEKAKGSATAAGHLERMRDASIRDSLIHSIDGRRKKEEAAKHNFRAEQPGKESPELEALKRQQ